MALSASRGRKSIDPLADYPQHLVRVSELSDGRTVSIRPIRPDDIEMEQAFVRHLSEESRYSRFMSHLLELSASKLKYFTEIDYDRHLALVAVAMQDAREVEIGVARYVALPQAGSCEFAIVVDDAWHGSGVASMLMAALIDAAREGGFTSMQGTVLTTNQRMLKFVRRLGFAVLFDPEDPGTLRVVRPLGQ
jgi:acetyltransferase